MIGMSIESDILLERPLTPAHQRLLDEAGGIRGFLAHLKEHGVGTVEIRPIRPEDNPPDMAAIAALLKEYGMGISVHSVPSLDDFDSWSHSMLPVYRMAITEQDVFTVTLHPITLRDRAQSFEATVAMLRRFGEIAQRHCPGMRFALENMRGPYCAVDIIEMVQVANQQNVGTCWDFGHYYYNMVYTGTLLKLPSEEFAARAFQTHIHGLVDLDTHYIITQETSPYLKPYLNFLNSYGYDGIHNLEITVSTLEPEESMLQALACSIEAVRSSVPAPE